MKKFNPPNEIVLDNNKKITGKVIIDGSGIVCIVGKHIGIDTKLEPRDIGVCIQSRVQSEFDANTIHMWFHKPYAPFGYAWLFPINKNEANIGLGGFGGQKLDLKKLLENMNGELPVVFKVDGFDFREVETGKISYIRRKVILE